MVVIAFFSLIKKCPCPFSLIEHSPVVHYMYMYNNHQKQPSYERSW